MLSSFFRGLPIVGYVIAGLSSIIVIGGITMFFMGRNITSLHEDLGAANSAIEILAEINKSNAEATNAIEMELLRCSHMRADAEDKASKATARIAQSTQQAYRNSNERVNEIEKDLNENYDGCGPFPPRTSELLVEAARSTNRGADDS